MISVDAAQLEAGLKILAGLNVQNAIVAFKSQSFQAKISNGLIIAEDAAELVGVFFPPAAVVVNDIEVGVEIAKVADALITVLLALPQAAGIGKTIEADFQTIAESAAKTRAADPGFFQDGL